jgi:hypothetical protein
VIEDLGDFRGFGCRYGRWFWLRGSYLLFCERGYFEVAGRVEGFWSGFVGGEWVVVEELEVMGRGCEG